MINAERQALGLSSYEVVVEDRRANHSIADRIAASPAATKLAVELLQQIATPPVTTEEPEQ